MHIRRTVAKIALAVLVAVLMMNVPMASQAEPGQDTVIHPAPWPGLPALPCLATHSAAFPDDCVDSPNQWGGTTQNGMAGSVKTKQWLNVPTVVMATHVGGIFSERNPSSGVSTANTMSVWTWFVSPDGSDRNYGESPVMPVRTLAFGSIPVEAELQVVQRRDSNGDPIPITLESTDGSLVGGKSYVDPAKSSNRIDVKVNALRVDGVKIDLRSACMPRNPATLTLTSEYRSGNAAVNRVSSFDQSRSFRAQFGGTLFGTLDMPAFSTCRTKAGDDLSPLLTATVSGEGNPITAHVGMFQCFKPYAEGQNGLLPPAPGEDTPDEANCFHLFPEGHYPGNPNMKVVMDKVEFPDKAPTMTERPEFDTPPLKTNWPW